MILFFSHCLGRQRALCSFSQPRDERKKTSGFLMAEILLCSSYLVKSLIHDHSHTHTLKRAETHQHTRTRYTKEEWQQARKHTEPTNKHNEATNHRRRADNVWPKSVQVISRCLRFVCDGSVRNLVLRSPYLSYLSGEHRAKEPILLFLVGFSVAITNRQSCLIFFSLFNVHRFRCALFFKVACVRELVRTDSTE